MKTLKLRNTPRSTLAVATCLSLALITGCSKKKPIDAVPKPSVQAMVATPLGPAEVTRHAPAGANG